MTATTTQAPRARIATDVCDVDRAAVRRRLAHARQTRTAPAMLPLIEDETALLNDVERTEEVLRAFTERVAQLETELEQALALLAAKDAAIENLTIGQSVLRSRHVPLVLALQATIAAIRAEVPISTEWAVAALHQVGAEVPLPCADPRLIAAGQSGLSTGTTL